MPLDYARLRTLTAREVVSAPLLDGFSLRRHSGAQRGDVATIRALWALQDRLALSPEKEQVIELKRDFIGGQERVIWNPASSIPTKESDLADAELTWIRTVLERWTAFGVGLDRR
jgi:hypothetical protein